MIVWTYFKDSFSLGNNYVPTGFKTELNNIVYLCAGYCGYLLETPDKHTLIVEARSGAIVGDIVSGVMSDIAKSDINYIEKQVKEAVEESKKVKIISEQEFWNIYLKRYKKK